MNEAELAARDAANVAKGKREGLATAAGIAPSYNVLDGFEGNLDESRHRGASGWRAIGLPWLQS